MWNLTNEHPLAWSRMSPEFWKPVEFLGDLPLLSLRYVDPVKRDQSSYP